MNEFDFINEIRRRAAANLPSSSSPITHHSSLLFGIGDDAAVLRQFTGRNTVITADLLVEDIDFRRHATPPALLGHKALAVSLSDLAAMGARPLWALTSIGMPIDIWESDFKDEFYSGFFALADRYDVRLIGGDVSRAEFWCGLRPMTPDGTPILGATRLKRLYLATGHGTLGWTMAAGTACVMADLISGRAPEIDQSGLTIERYPNAYR